MPRWSVLAMLMLSLVLSPAPDTHAFATNTCTTIPELQGPGNVTPCEGHRDQISGCITGVTATGFFFQDLAGDGDTNTSDGIYASFWSSWTNPDGLKPGNLVSVSGTITETNGTTAFAHLSADPLQVTVTGSCTLPAPVSILPYLDPIAEPQVLYEHRESMRVIMSFIGWVVGPTRRYPSRHPAGFPEIAFVDDRSPIPNGSRIFERDYPGYQGITYLNGGLGYDLYNFGFGDRVFSGALTGVLAYQHGRYTLLFENPERLGWELAVRPPPATPRLDRARGEFDVCFFNAGSLFDPLNDGQGDWGDWAPGWPTPGTAAGEGDYRWKLERVARTIAERLGGCMVVGLQEVEGKQQVWDDLATRIAELSVSGDGPQYTWTGRYVTPGDARNIAQGFLVRSDVMLVGGSLAPVAGAPYTGWVTGGTLDFVRTPAAGQFRFNAGTPNEVTMWAYSVQLAARSSSSSCTTPDCTDRREKEAADLRDILLHHQAAGEYAIGGGDFNATHGSSPIGIMDGEPGAEPGLNGLWYELPENTRYSYIDSGESLALDHVYVAALALGSRPWKRGLYPMHFNADLPSADASSGHDPLRVIFWVPAEEDHPLFLPLVLQTDTFLASTCTTPGLPTVCVPQGRKTMTR